MDIRGIRRAARAAIHQGFAVPALYVEAPGVAPKPMRVRVHTTHNRIGAVNTVRYPTASVENVSPRIIFSLDDLQDAPAGAIFSIAVGEAYKVDHSLDADDTYRTVCVERLPERKTTGLPVPA